jgi:hypothetical protein
MAALSRFQLVIKARVLLLAIFRTPSAFHGGLES